MSDSDAVVAADLAAIPPADHEIAQIALPATAIIAAAAFFRGGIVGAVLAAEPDGLFTGRCVG
ncbi:MAG: hypothetical protein ACM3JG_16915 [Thiohalocapsa sp.]